MEADNARLTRMRAGLALKDLATKDTSTAIYVDSPPTPTGILNTHRCCVALSSPLESVAVCTLKGFVLAAAI